MNILADFSLHVYSEFFPKPFKLFFYKNLEEIRQLIENMDVLLCRSTLKVNASLLSSPGLSLSAIATASSGTDHIDSTYLQSNKIKLFDARGANAHAVADYVLTTIAFMQRNYDCKGKRVGIIGLGMVGEEVATRLAALSFEILYYDPYKNGAHAAFQSASLEEILAQDIICIHANLHDTAPYPSRRLLGKKELAKLKSNTVIINVSRGDIVHEDALLEIGPPIFYCTDVYANEPNISAELIDFASLCTPHIAGHSIEAKRNAALILSQKLQLYFQIAQPSALPRIEKLAMPMLDNNNPWQDKVLAMYNPLQETIALKQALNKKEAFLRLRREHTARHDFYLGNQEQACMHS